SANGEGVRDMKTRPVPCLGAKNWRKFLLDIANKKRNTQQATRWAMSPVLTNPAPGFSDRRRPATPTAARLFPDGPEVHSPKTAAGEPAPLYAGPSGERSQAGTADCPLPVAGTAERPSSSPAGMSPGAKAPLVGIARLAAFS